MTIRAHPIGGRTRDQGRSALAILFGMSVHCSVSSLSMCLVLEMHAPALLVKHPPPVSYPLALAYTMHTVDATPVDQAE